MAEIKPLNDQDQALLGGVSLLGETRVEVPKAQPFVRGSFRPLSDEDQSIVQAAVSNQPAPQQSGSVMDKIVSFGRRNLQKPSEDPQKLAASYGLVSDIDPDQEAMDREIARELNIPSWVLKLNKSNRDAAIEMIMQGKGPNYDWETLSQRSPKLAAWLQNPENMAVAKDDVTNLAQTEWFFDSLKRGWKSGTKQLELAELGYRQLFGDKSAYTEIRAAQLEAEMANEKGPDGWFPQSFYGAAQLGPQLLEQLRQGAKYGSAGALVAGGAAAAAGPAAPITVPVAGGAALSAGMITGAMETAFKLEAGSAYREFANIKDVTGAQVDPDVAKVAAIMVGAANAGIEAFQLKWLVESIPGADKLVAKLSRETVKEMLRNRTYSEAFVNFAKKWAGTASKETATEILQEGITILGGEGAKKVSGQRFAPVPEGTHTDRLIDTGIQSFQAFSLLALPGPTAGFISDTARAARVQENVAKIQALGDTAQSSKLLQRMPVAYQEFVKELKKEGPVENIYIPAEQFVNYFQDNAQKVAQELGVDNQLMEALAAGGDIAIPLEVYSAKLAGTDHHKQLSMDIRLREDDMTVREAQEFEKRKMDYFQQEVERAKQILAAESKENQDAVFISEQVKNQLIANGRSSMEAEAAASIYAARAIVASRQLGITPVEWLQRKGLVVHRSDENVIPLPKQPIAKRADANIVDRLISAIAAQESAGNPNAVNSLSGASGKFQIMPENWPVWAQEAGVDPADMSEANQDRVARYKIQQYLMQFGDPRLVAAAWYAGPGYAQSLKDGAPLFDPDAMQEGNHPSVNSYINEVMGRMGDTFFQYAGTNALTADTMRLGAAKDMEAQGFDPETIRQQTGWFKGMDGKWRFEIDDSKASIKEEYWDLPLGEIGKLGQLIDHPDLFAAYPDLANVAVVFDKKMKAGSASYNLTLDAITIADKQPLNSEMETLLHEIQHAIQAREGFARGGNPDALQQVDNEIREQINKLKGDRVDLPSWGLGRKIDSLYEKLFSGTITDQEHADLIEALDELKTVDPEGQYNAVSDKIRILEKQLALPAAPKYRSLAGEIEARDTASRANLNSEARMLTKPNLRDDAIVIYNGREMAYHPENVMPVSAIDTSIVDPEMSLSDYAKAVRPEIKAALGGQLVTNDRTGQTIRISKDGLKKSFNKARTKEHLLMIAKLPELIKNAIHDGPTADEKGRDRVLGWHYYYAPVLVNGNLSVVRIAVEEVLENVSKNIVSMIFHNARIIGTIENYRNEPANEGLQANQQEPAFGSSPLSISEFEDIVNSMRRGTLFQTKGRDKGKKPSKGPRGAITFEPARVIITLFKNADRSTFMHETGHLFLEDMQDIVLSGKASGLIRQDFETVKEWLGVTPEQVNEKGRIAFTRAQHEQFARGWEAYLMEGKSPSVKLQNVFRSFKKWLTAIYRSIRGLNVEITPDIRAVMDRMIATEDEIKEAEVMAGYNELFAEEAGKTVSMRDYEQYLKLAAEARAVAEEQLIEAQMAEFTEERKVQLAEERQRAEEKAREEVLQLPIYRALAEMEKPESEGGIKINVASVVKYYGESMLGYLPKNIFSGMSALDLDDAADIFGYSSGDHLIQALAEMKPMEEEIQQRVDAHMAQFERETGSKIKEDAQRAVRNDKRLEMLALERAMIEELTKGGSNADARIRAVANKQLQAALNVERQRLMGEHIRYLVANSAQGVERRTMTDDGQGGYVFAAGYSNNEPWYSDILALAPSGQLPGNWYDFIQAFKAGQKDLAQMPETMRQTYEAVADEHMRNGVQTKDGFIPENETYVAVVRAIEDVERALQVNKDVAVAPVPMDAESVRQLALDLEADRKQRARDALARARAVKAAAKVQIANKRYVEAIQASRYFAAERRAAFNAERHMKAGEYQAAAWCKDQQMLNHALAMEAIRVKTEVDKTIKYFEKFTKRTSKTKLAVDPDYMEQIDDLLDRFDFKRASQKVVQKRKSLRDWIIDQEANMEVVTIPDKLRDEAFRVHYSDLTVDELRDLEDGIRNIEHLGRLKNKLLTAKNNRLFDEAVDDLVTAIAGNNMAKPQSLDPNEEGLEKWLSRARSAHAQLSKIEFVVRQMDGHKDLGTAWYYLFRPIIEAEEQEILMRKETETKLKVLFDQHSTAAERTAWKTRKVYIKEVNLSLTKENIISLALNMGNEGNRNRVKAGRGWGDQQIDAILDHMTKADWDLVQGIWDYIDTFYPQINQLTKDVAGVKLPKVDASPVKTKFGEYKGGYYPIKYDPRMSEAAFAFDEAERQKSFFENQFFRAATKKGHTKDRAETVVGRPVRLDLSVLSEHLTNVIHDLAYRRAIRDVDKLIRHKDVQQAIVDTLGREVYRQFNPWLQAIGNEYKEPVNYLEHLASRVRKGTTVVAMGWKITTALAQPLGAFNFMERIGAKRTIAALSDFYLKPHTWKEKIDKVMELSVFMRTRTSNYDRDIKQSLDQLIKDNKFDKFKETFFWHIGFMDLSISVPVWIDEFDRVYDKTKNKEKAIRAADALIRQTQGSGAVKDLAAVQRGSEMQKLFTMFYTYFNALYNLFASRIQQTKGTSDIPRLIAAAAYLWWFPALLGELVTGRGPDEDDDEEKKLKWMAKMLIAYPFAAIPGVRDVVGSLTSGYDYKMSPAADAVESFVKAGWAGAKAWETGSDQDIKKFGKRSAEALGYFTGLPAKQLLITLGAFYDYIVNEAEFDISDALLGTKKKK